MKKFFMVMALAICINMIVPAPKAEAIVVYDPTNYSANIQTSLKQVESVVNELKMLENQAKNLANLGQVAELGQLKSTLSKLMALKGQVGGLLDSFENFQVKWDGTFKDFASINGMSAKDYAAYAKSQIETLNKTALAAAKVQTQVKEDINTDAEALQALLDASANTSGALQAAQAGNQIGGVIAQQLLKLQTAMTNSNQAQLSYVAYLQKKDEAAAEEGKRFFQADHNVTGGGGLDKW